jgi:ribosome-associated protein
MAKIDFLVMAERSASIAEDKKALNTVILDVRDLTAIANYFVIATAESTPQINAVCGEIEKTFKEEGITVVRREGVSSASWRVLDYGGLVVHVMSPQVRDLYNLEKLWRDAKTVKTKASVLKIQKPEIVAKIEEKFKESAEEGKKAAKAVKKKIFKEKKAIQKEYSKKLSEAKKEAKKTVKKGIETAKSKVKNVKKTVKAVGKGIEAFGKTLVKKSVKKSKPAKKKSKK